MEQLTVNQWLEKSEHLKKLSNSILFLEKETFDSYKNDEKVKVRLDISIKLLKDLITNESYYKYVSKLFNDEIKELSCAYIINGDMSPSIKLNKNDIVLGLMSIIYTNKIDYDDFFLERYNDLFDKVSYDEFLNKYKDTYVEYTIDDNKINIPFNNIIDFLELSEEEYQEFFYKNHPLLQGIKKEYFVYIILNIFKKNEILNNYLLPENMKNRIINLRDNQNIDIEALNRISHTEEIIDKIVINEELENYILKNIPPQLTSIEKAIYIYIKLCKTLKYDGEYFTLNQKGNINIKHNDIEHLKEISINHNEVICWELNAIYAKILNDIQINLKFNRSMLVNYGGGHTNLTFRADNFLVKADSVTSILNGDLIRAKLNYPLKGLTCVNTNKNTKEEFNNIVDKIYKLIIQEETQEKIEEIKDESFDDILLAYKNATSNEIYLDINEKLDLLMAKITDSNLTGMDAFSYMLTLRKIIFDDYEREFNINITIIRNNDTINNIEASPSAIITINPFDLNDIDSNMYYLYNPNEPLYYISLSNLKKRFKEGYIEYIDEANEKDRIPGILSGKGLK